MESPATPGQPPDAGNASDQPRCKGQTLVEAGHSLWAPLWLLMSVRVLLALCLVATAAFMLGWGGRLFSVGRADTALSALFWGPLVHAAGLLLLVACGFRSRRGASAADAGGKLPCISGAVYQAGCVLTSAGGGYMIVWSSIVWHPWPHAAVGSFLILCFLVDALVLGGMVRFRFLYVWIGVAVYAVLLIVNNVVVWTVLLRGFEPSAGSVGAHIGISFLHLLVALIAGVVQTLLTRAVAQCFSGKRSRSSRESFDVEEPAGAGSE